MRLPLFLLAGLAFVGPAFAQSAISPGYWETDNRVLSPVPSGKIEKRCIHPTEVAKFMEGPSNHIYKCTYPVRHVGGGKIQLQGSCATKTGKPVPISGEGVYTADTLRMDVRIATEIGGFVVPIHARTEAKRIGDTCPEAPTP